MYSVLESALCSRAECKDISLVTPFSASLEIGVKLWRTFLLLLKESFIQLS